MPQYVGYSAEVGITERVIPNILFIYFSQELRVQDYAQGRKTATTTTAGFGQPTTAFGATQQTNSGLFGAQPAQQTAPSLFGGTSTTNTANPSTTFGAFGQPLNQPSTTNTGNLFGGGAFGQPQQQQQQQQPQQQQQNAFGGGNAFGQPQQQQTNAFGGGSSVFGNNAAKPAFTPFGGGTYLLFTLRFSLMLRL
jgi:nuclear pore complex protein Nup98-Nup96